MKLTSGWIKIDNFEWGDAMSLSLGSFEWDAITSLDSYEWGDTVRLFLESFSQSN